MDFAFCMRVIRKGRKGILVLAEKKSGAYGEGQVRTELRRGNREGIMVISQYLCPTNADDIWWRTI